ncbi:permease-like cell division protein FtsX [Embleya sp. NPDC059237]|uniref:permease-like cell division protein FtsX n=1 Tax=Embleya sp. NPDC059237 TaxID=3346784 RepID=UPI003690C153
MTTLHASHAGRITIGCAAALLAITAVAGCSGGNDKPSPKHAAVKSSAPAGSAAPDDNEATEAGESKLPPPGVDYWADKADLAVFLCRAAVPKGGCYDGPVTSAQLQEIADALKAMPQVQHVYYENRQQAWELFRAQNANNPALLAAMTAEQLPESFRVKLRSPDGRIAVVTAMEGRAGVESTMDHNRATPPPPAAPGPLTQEQARRAVLTADDVGPGWSGGALTDTGSKPASGPYSGSSGDTGCDRAIAGAPAGAITIALGARREFESVNGLRLAASVQVYDGNSAALQVAKTRAMLAGCTGIPMPYQGTTARFSTLPAPALGDESLGIRVIVEHDGPKTVDSILIRVGPNLAGIVVTPLADNVTLPPATLDRLARQAADLLRAATRN